MSYILTALIAGFFTGVHCLGMCGGIVGVLTMGLAPQVRAKPIKMLPYHLAYNLGRITTYSLMGLVMGLFGALLIGYFKMSQVHFVLRIVAGVFMIAMGLYLAGWWHGLSLLEKLGHKIWRYVEPIAKKILPIQSPAKALLVGLLWGAIPCGPVYAALALALASGTILNSTLVMLAFGLGTLPTLFAMGLFSSWLSQYIRKAWVRQLSGALVIAFGVAALWNPAKQLIMGGSSCCQKPHIQSTQPTKSTQHPALRK
jgi:hypothetical protein